MMTPIPPYILHLFHAASDFILQLKQRLDPLKDHDWPYWVVLGPLRCGATWEVFWSLGMSFRGLWVPDSLPPSLCILSTKLICAHHVLPPGCEAPT